jgi:hypothetical protein
VGDFCTICRKIFYTKLLYFFDVQVLVQYDDSFGNVKSNLNTSYLDIEQVSETFTIKLVFLPVNFGDEPYFIVHHLTKLLNFVYNSQLFFTRL